MGEQTGRQSAIDPICGMSVDPQNARHTASHNGETYYFCAAGCKTAFEKEPETYLKADPPPHRAMGSGLVQLTMPEVPVSASVDVATSGRTRLDVPIQGMHCASCVSSIEQALGKVPGVSSVAVNFATERVAVEFDPSRVNIQTLTGAVEASGPYQLLVTEGGAAL